MVGCLHARCTVVFASQFEPLYPSCAEGGNILPLSLNINSRAFAHVVVWCAVLTAMLH